MAGGAGSPLGSGGMASKVAAAKIATWSGVETIIADAARPGVVAAAVAGEPGVGTVFRARPGRLSARKLWIAFALGASGRLVVDQGAQDALAGKGRSLLPAGVVAAEGDFGPDDAVEIIGPDGKIFAKGLARLGSARSSEWIGRRSDQLPEDMSHLVVHRDDLVLVR
jgi:glutamate 5-kinase